MTINVLHDKQDMLGWKSSIDSLTLQVLVKKTPSCYVVLNDGAQSSSDPFHCYQLQPKQSSVSLSAPKHAHTHSSLKGKNDKVLHVLNHNKKYLPHLVVLIIKWINHYKMLSTWKSHTNCCCCCCGLAPRHYIIFTVVNGMEWTPTPRDLVDSWVEPALSFCPTLSPLALYQTMLRYYL